YQRGYAGTRPKKPDLAPQISAVARTFAAWKGVPGAPQGPREVDVALISIGVNDLGFGPVLSFCTKAGIIGTAGCEDIGAVATVSSLTGKVTLARKDGASTTLRDEVARMQGLLPAKYPPLRAALAKGPQPDGGGLGLTDMKRVFFTTYPDFASGDDGQPCDTQSSSFASATNIPKWPRSTWAWLQEQSGVLNQKVAAGAGSLGANVVMVPGEIFRARGYCAKDSYFVPISTAVLANDLGGPFHPNRFGHLVSEKYNREAVCARLYGNANCSGKPKA
ncbi:MAG: hypothetical protein AB1416_03530, partial [Actinomycetota bacterium]